MSVPFDTLQLARRFEAAGFSLDQAGKMAEAIAQATAGADLATKRDLRDLEQRLTIRFGSMLIVAVGLLLAGLGATTSIILNRLPAATTRQAAMLIAAAQQEPPYSCRLYYDEQKNCAFAR